MYRTREAAPLVAALRDAAIWLTTLRQDGPDLTLAAHHKTVMEARELARDLTPEEWADVAICLVGVALAQRWSLRTLARAVRDKVAVNRERRWAQRDDGTWQHL